MRYALIVVKLRQHEFDFSTFIFQYFTYKNIWDLKIRVTTNLCSSCDLKIFVIHDIINDLPIIFSLAFHTRRDFCHSISKRIIGANVHSNMTWLSF